MEKVIIITGGSRGIGLATACLAAERGYAVCVNYLRNQQEERSLMFHQLLLVLVSLVNM
jgi:NAD(P)-dependent dehydrogenase (short-subunit alcohol dehydrogenase family)